MEYGFGGDSFIVVFIYSIVVTNTSFAMYYIPPIISGFISGISLFSLIFTFSLLSYKFIKSFKTLGTNAPEYLQFFIMVAITWQIYATTMSCLTISNWNNSPTIWNIDSKYVAASTERNWFYILQAIPGVIALVVTLILGFIALFRCCIVSSCCFDLRSDIKKSIDEAKRFSADVVANEVTPIPDMPAKDVTPTEASVLLNYRIN